MINIDIEIIKRFLSDKKNVKGSINYENMTSKNTTSTVPLNSKIIMDDLDDFIRNELLNLHSLHYISCYLSYKSDHIVYYKTNDKI